LLLFGEESERLQFRKLETSDFDNWLEFCADPESLKFIWLTDSESPKDRCEAWFFRVMNRYATGKN
jgi:[ribosomal protein S5]-alanine N-acetyltransferase